MVRKYYHLAPEDPGFPEALDKHKRLSVPQQPLASLLGNFEAGGWGSRENRRSEG